MAIALDSRNGGTKSAAATSLSWNHTVGAALTGGFLVVGCYGATSPRPTVSSVVWDSGVTDVALSNTVNAVAAVKADTSGFANVYLWYLAAPASGAKTIKVTYSASCECSAGSESLSGVDGSSPFNAASPQSSALGSNINPTVDVTSASGEWVMDCVSCIINGAGAVTPVAGASQTAYYSQSNGAGVSGSCGSDEAATGATTTMNWTGFTTNNDATGQIAFSLKPGGSAVLTGTVTATITEADIVAGGKTVIATLTGETFVAAGAVFDAARAAIASGLNSDVSEAAGWNATVRPNIPVGNVVRTSGTVCTVTLQAQADYDITGTDRITWTLPAAALTGGVAMVATPTFTVTAIPVTASIAWLKA